MKKDDELIFGSSNRLPFNYLAGMWGGFQNSYILKSMIDHLNFGQNEY